MVLSDSNPFIFKSRSAICTSCFSYLTEQIPVIPVALGLFAIPEIVDLCIRGTHIVEQPKQALKGKMAGLREAFHHKKLIASSTAIGAFIGFLPGASTAAANWIAYSWGIVFAKDKEKFGKGDIRGVIAPESANNASVGGSLIPTIAFGVPGGAAMALILVAFMIQGITPGPDLLTRHLDLVYLMVWTLALANIIGAGICFFMTDYLALLTKIDIRILGPMVFVMLFSGAFLSTRDIGDVVALLGLGILGWVFKHLEWPRPALVLGFVLTRILEKYYFISTMRYGFAWLFRPTVLGILALAVLGIYFGRRLPAERVRIGASGRT